ncbi:phage tail tape measure protein [Aerococcaceae bacterium NML210727]|nr:phage tail tape measure protein [Aerococcaceae bacterium NML210727]MCW6655087.1 phage tail tape measure protein [Aerococcaceae bacterium NML201296]
MALKEAGIRLTLQGEATYIDGLKRINAEMKLLQTQSKTAMASLGTNAKSGDVFRTTLSNLTKQLDTSESKTKLLETAQDSYRKSLLNLKQSISETTAKYAESSNKTAELKQKYDEIVQSEGKRSKAAKEANKAYQLSKSETNSLAKEVKDLNETFDGQSAKLGKLPQDLANAELASAKLREEIKRTKQAFIANGGDYADVAKKWKEYGNALKDAGAKNLLLGSQLTSTFTRPIVSGFKSATIEAGKFYTEIGQLGPLLTNGGEITADVRKEMDLLGKSSREWAVDYGKNTSEINSGMSELIRNGYTSSQVMGMIPNILDASLASGESFNAVMTTSSQVLSQFNLKGNTTADTLKNTQRVTDSLTYVANATASGFTDLGAGMAYVGPVANSLNMSVEETASILGILSNKGIEASAGGTALRGALTRLLKPSKQNARAMAELGISSEGFRNGSLTLPDIIDRIKESTKDWTDEQRAAAIATAFGTESQTAMNALVEEGGDALRTMTKEAEGASGATKKVAESMRDLPEFKYQQLMAQVRDLGIELGSELLPVAQEVMAVIKDVVRWFVNLDDETKKNVVRIGLLVAALGPLVSAFGALQTVGGLATTVMGNLIQTFGKNKAVKEFGEAVINMGDDVAVGASNAGAAAGLFSNPWVLAGSAAIGAVAGFIWYMNNEAQAPFAAHNESVKETEGAYQEWFDAVSAGISAIDQLNKDAQKGAEETTKTYQETVAQIMGDNQEVQGRQAQMWSEKDWLTNLGNNYHNWGEQYIDGKVYKIQYDDLRATMASFGRENEFDAMLPQIENFTTMLGNATLQTMQYYNNHNKVTEEWAWGQISAVRRVTDNIVSNYDQQKQTELIALEDKRQSMGYTKQWYDEQVAQLNANYTQKQQIVRDAEANIKGILQKAKVEQRNISEEEALSMLKSYQQLSEEAGRSLSTIPEVMNLVGDNMMLFTSTFGLEFLKTAGIIDEATLTMVEQLETTEERTNALKKALEGVGNLHVAPEVQVDGLPQAIESIEQYNGLSIQDKIASLSALGTEDIVMMLEKLGLWQQLSPERKEVITNAIGLEQVEEVMWALNGYNAFTPEEKEIIMQTQTAQLGLSDLITQSDLWNNTDFKSELININTTGPQAEAEIINLINKYRETQGLEPITVEATTVGVSGATAEMQGFGAASVGIQDKSATVTTDVLSMALNTLAIIAYNAASGAMTDKTSTATTLTPSILSNTLSGWNWIGMLNNTYSKSSTLTTYVDRIYRTFGKHATGGHIGMFAQGGNISKWGGMFANGGNVPSGYAGIVGEAGPEIFQVTKQGVSITPLNTREKMRGIKGVLEDLNGSNNGGQQINVSVQVSDIVIRDDRDIDSLATLIGEKISKNIQRDRIMRKGTSVGHVV